jgi:hypothetical protein
VHDGIEREKQPNLPDAGLGRVIYNVDDETSDESNREAESARRDVEIADKESFPASDPPGFLGGAVSDAK